MRAPILALVLASVPAIASAQEAPPPPIAPMAPPAAGVVAPAAEPADIARLEDPNIDRVFLLPSADTQPKGTFAFNDYELFMIGLTYGVTDNFQLSATTLAPIVKDMPTFLSASAKLRVVGEGRVHLALQGTLTYVNDGDDGDSEESVFGGSLGALATFCLDEPCRSALHASVTGMAPIAENNSSENFLLVYSAGATVKVAKHVKLLGEVTSAGINDEDSGFDQAEGALVSYGVRFFSGSIAGDVGFVKPLYSDDEGDGDDDDDFLLGVPFINFTFRQ
jgi:hypothetical protein